MKSSRACIRSIASFLLLGAVVAAYTGNAFAYCISKGNSSAYEWIQSVNVAGVVKVSGNNGGYANFFEPVINLNAGVNSLALTAGGSYSEYWKVWIDFNNNDDFGTDEVVYSGYGRTLSGGITIPATAASGERGMRVSMKYGSTPSPCGNFTYGEVEDYRVYLNTIDTVPPTVASKMPDAGAVDVPVNTAITVHFSENLDPAGIDDSSISLIANGVPVAGAVNLNGKIATFVPSQQLEYSSAYHATVHAGILDLAGNALAQDITWSFATVDPDLTPPEVTQTAPAHGGANVSVSQIIQATFSEPLDPQTVDASTVLVSNASGNIAGNVTLSADRRNVLFHPLQPLAYLTAYTATVTSGVSDESGNGLPSDHVWNFTTLEYQPQYCSSYASYSTIMWISGVRVGDQTHASGGNTYSNHTATLFQLDRESPQSFTLTPAYSNYVYTAYWKIWIDWNQDGVFSAAENASTGIGNPLNGNITVPATALSGNTRMRVSVQYGNYPPACGALSYGEVEDYRVNVPAPVADTTAPTVTSTTPAHNAQNVNVGAAISASFSEAMYAATVNAQSFTLSSANGPVTALVSYDAPNKRAVLTPASALSYSTVYTAALSGLEDLAGNALDDYSWSFTTQVEPPPVYTVSGKVLRNGEGVSDVLLQLERSGYWKTTATASDGSYSFTDVPAGSYQLWASKGGYKLTPPGQSISVVNAGVTVPDINAQIFPGHVVNGDFETGDFSGFTLFETSSGHMVESVAPFATLYGDIPSQAARFYVGNDGTNAGYDHGGGIYQTVNLSAGDLYASMNLASAYINSNTGCLVQVFFDGELVASHDFGSLSAGVTKYKTLSFSRTGVTAGGHELRILLTRKYATTSVACYIDDIVLSGSSTQ